MCQIRPVFSSVESLPVSVGISSVRKIVTVHKAIKVLRHKTILEQQKDKVETYNLNEKHHCQILA